MKDLFNNPIFISAAGGLLAFLSGLVGFFIRSLKTYSKPLIRILKFERGNLSYNENVEINSELSKLLNSIKSAVVVTSNSESISTLRDSYGFLIRWEEATNYFKDDVAAYLDTIKNDNITDGDINETITKSLRTIFDYDILDGLLVATVGRGLIKIPQIDPNLKPVLKVVKSKSKNGCYVAYLPDPCTIGKELDSDPAYEHYYKAFSMLLANAEHSKLGAVFKQLSDILVSDLPSFKDARRILRKILEDHEIFTSTIYFANLTSTPILIEPKAELIVDGVKTSKKILSTSLNLMKEVDFHGKSELEPFDYAVVIPAGTDMKFFAYTESSSKMKNGNIFQAVFAEGESTARIKLFTESIGFFGKRTITTPKKNFSYEF